MILIAFRHDLRASELVNLRWEQIDLEHALLHVRRDKNGNPATHPLTGKELRVLRRLEREQQLKSPFVFTSERGTPFTKRGFQAMVERAGQAAGFDNEATSTHAPACLRVQPGQRWRRYTDPSRPISATSQSSIRCVTPSWHRLASRACFGIELLRNLAQKGDPFFSNKKGDPTPMTPIEGGARKRCVRPPEASFIATHVAPMRTCFFGEAPVLPPLKKLAASLLYPPRCLALVDAGQQRLSTRLLC